MVIHCDQMIIDDCPEMAGGCGNSGGIGSRRGGQPQSQITLTLKHTQSLRPLSLSVICLQLWQPQLLPWRKETSNSETKIGEIREIRERKPQMVRLISGVGSPLGAKYGAFDHSGRPGRGSYCL